jgi:hypothetical protein
MKVLRLQNQTPRVSCTETKLSTDYHIRTTWQTLVQITKPVKHLINCAHTSALVSVSLYSSMALDEAGLEMLRGNVVFHHSAPFIGFFKGC